METTPKLASDGTWVQIARLLAREEPGKLQAKCSPSRMLSKQNALQAECSPSRMLSKQCCGEIQR